MGRIDTSLDVNLPIFGKQDLGGAAYNLPAFLLEEIGNAYPRVIWGSKTATQGAKEKDFNKVLLGGATAGEGLFDIATIGIGKSAVKEGIEQVTKRSFKELLGEAMQVGGKQLTKNFVKSEGFKQGLGQGSLIGIENAIDSNKDADIYSILRSSLGTAAMGGIFGGVAEGALKYGSEGLTRGISDTVSYLKRPEIQTALKSQEGAIDTDLLTGGIDRILSGNSKALDPHDLKPSDIGKKLPRETAERMLRNNTPENVEALQKTYAQLSRSTLYDTFQPEKAGEALKYYVDTLGGKTVNQIRKEVFGKEVMSGKKVKIFWDTLAERSGKTINEILDEQTVKAAANELGETTTSQISKEIDAAIPESTKAVQETPQIQEILAKQETKKGVYQALRGVLDTLPAKDEVRSVEQAAKAYTAGTTAIRTSGEELSVRLKKAGLNEADIVDMIEGKTPITKEAAPYVQELQNILADLLPFTEDSSIGDIGRQYWPRMNKGYTQNVDKLMDQLFPNVWVNKLTTMGGNFMERKGVEFEYSKDIAKTLNDYGEQVLYRKYRKDFQPSTEAVEAVVKHVEELGDDFYNYVEKLGPEKVKEITWGSRILGGALRTYDSVFTRIKKRSTGSV